MYNSKLFKYYYSIIKKMIKVNKFKNFNKSKEI